MTLKTLTYSKNSESVPPIYSNLLYPSGCLDYICNSKTNKSVSVSLILGKLIWKQFKSVSVISGVQV